MAESAGPVKPPQASDKRFTQVERFLFGFLREGLEESAPVCHAIKSLNLGLKNAVFSLHGLNASSSLR
jgi:hypothetical protein